MNLLQAVVDKVIPCARITVQKSWRLDGLPAIRLAALALEGVVRVGGRVQPQLKELTQTVQRKVTLDVLGGIDDAGREGLLVRLSLEYLLLDAPGGDEAVHEACRVSRANEPEGRLKLTILLLTVSPDTRQSLLVGGRVPVWVRLAREPTSRQGSDPPGSKRMSRFAPMRFRPQPPALLLKRKTNSAPLGSLNLSTSFCRLLTAIEPSRRREP